MKKQVAHIGVLTSGGDAPGMNAAIRAVVRSALYYNLRVSGIYRGYNGLVEGDICELNVRSVAHIISLGGTILKSSRSEAFFTKEGREKAYEQVCAHKIDALVIIGGDGSMRGAAVFQDEYDIPVIGLPGTIDNDLFGTDFTIGFDTAINVAMDCVDKIRVTANSHDRLFLVEVMGRDTGHIALATAVACGAVAVMMPEDPTTIDQLFDHLRQLEAAGKSAYIIIVAEGNPNGNAFEIGEKLKQLRPSYDIRVSVLGHVQRGGTPTASERIRAAEMGAHAVDSLLLGERGVMVGIVNQQLTLTPINQAVNQKAGFNQELYRISQMLSR